MKKILAIILCVAMLIPCAMTNVFAEGDTVSEDTSGTVLYYQRFGKDSDDKNILGTVEEAGIKTGNRGEVTLAEDGRLRVNGTTAYSATNYNIDLPDSIVGKDDTYTIELEFVFTYFQYTSSNLTFVDGTGTNRITFHPGADHKDGINIASVTNDETGEKIISSSSEMTTDSELSKEIWGVKKGETVANSGNHVRLTIAIKAGVLYSANVEVEGYTFETTVDAVNFGGTELNIGSYASKALYSSIRIVKGVDYSEYKGNYAYTSKNGYVDPAVTTLGMQPAKNGNNAVRFAAEIRGLDFDEAGFNVDITYKAANAEVTAEPTEKNNEIPVEYAYTSILGGGNLYTRSSLNYYIIVIEIKDIPDDAKELEITAKPYVKEDNKTVYGIECTYDPYITLYRDNASCVSIVYDKSMNTKVLDTDIMPLPSYTAAEKFRGKLCEKMEVDPSLSTAPALIKDDTYVENQCNTAILWGKTAYPEAIEVYKNIAPNEYGFCIVGNKIVVYGNTLEEIEKGAAALLEQIEVKDGLIRISRTAKQQSFTEDLAILALPTPTVGTNLLLCDDGDDARMWVAEGCTANDFDTYTAELEKKGFTLYSNNEITNNLATGEKINKYATYTKDDIIADVWYTIDGYLRITASRGFDLPEKTSEGYEKVAETGLFIVGPDVNQSKRGMLMFFRLDDGSFFVIDGGNGTEMWNLLIAELEKQAPDKNNIVIRCWMFTHSHGDHTGAIDAWQEKYKTSLGTTMPDNLTIESFMYNFAGSEQALVENQNLYKDETLRDIFANEFPDVKKYKVHPGNEFDFANMHLEVLSTHENGIKNQYPMARNDCNTSVKITLEGQTIIIMGDTGFVNQEMLGTVYGDYLKCDILQAAHHGYTKGGIVSTNLLYAPEVVLFIAPWVEGDSESISSFIDKDFNQALINKEQNSNFEEYLYYTKGETLYMPFVDGVGYIPKTSVPLSHGSSN